MQQVVVVEHIATVNHVVEVEPTATTVKLEACHRFVVVGELCARFGRVFCMCAFVFALKPFYLPKCAQGYTICTHNNLCKLH